MGQIKLKSISEYIEMHLLIVLKIINSFKKSIADQTLLWNSAWKG